MPTTKVTVFANDPAEAEENYEQILQVAFRLLRMCFLWPKKGQSSNSFSFKVINVIVLIAFSTTGLACLLYVAHTFSTGANYLFADILEDMVVISSNTGVYLILITLRRRSDLINQLIMELGRFGEFGKPPKFDERNSQMNKMLWVLYFYSYFAVALYASISLVDYSHCEAVNERLGLDRLCGFMAAMWIPFATKNFAVKAVFFVFQMTTCVFGCACTCLTIGLFLAIVEMLLTRISHLKAMLLEINDMPENVKKRAHFNKCIRYHIHIIRMGDQINECLGGLIFLASCVITLILGLLCAHFLIQPEIYTVFHGLGWVSLMFILCHAGQRLVDESEEIPLGVYEFNWFDCDLSVQKDVIFFIMRSNRPLRLEAAGYFVVSMSTFTAVIKNAYSFMALLQQTLREDE